tara:strand:- start:234 stop:1031 length:798 start_codon:yes stop_codon:yes gene_type:complete
MTVKEIKALFKGKPRTKPTGRQIARLERKRIQDLIDGSQETKVAVYESPIVGVSQSANTTGVLKILPDISHGVNSWQRTGQKVRLTKLVVRGHYFINKMGFTAETAGEPSGTEREKFRFLARRFVLKDKENGNYENVGTSDLNFLLEAPGAVGQAYDGSLLSHNAPINVGKFTKKRDEKRYLTTKWRQVSTSGANELSATDNNVIFFKDEYDFGGNGLELLYDGSSQPINFPMFMTMGYATVNNITKSANIDVQLQYVATAYYKD